MVFRGVKSLFSILSVAFILCCSAACTHSESPNSAEFRAGQVPFQFETKKVTSIEIAKADRKTGDSWTAKFQRNNDGEWEVASGPGGSNLLDRKAHSTLIDHLLDTLKTLRVTAPAPKGPPESFELSPPHFAIRWSGNEMRLGAGKFVAIGPSIYEMEGAALKMIELIESFQTLRQQTWLSPLTSDDVDEIELYRGKKKYFYAQRDGSVWTDQKHKPVRQDVAFFLDQLTHTRIEEFVDTPQLSARLVQSIRKAPTQHIIFKDRNGRTTEADLKWEVVDASEKLYGTTSSRPGSAFRIFPEAIRFFESFQK